VPLDSLVLSLRNQFPGSSPLEWSAAAHQLGQHVARYVVHQEIETWLDRPVRPQDLVYCGLSPSDADGLLQPPQRGTYVDAWRHLEEVYLTAKHVLRPELDAQLHAEPAELPEGVDLGALQTLLFGPTFTTLEQATARLPTAGQLLEAHMRHLYDLQVRVLALQRMQEEGWTLLEVDEADETLLVRRNMGIIVFSTGEEATMPHTLAQLAALAGPSLQEAIARGATPLLALRQRWSAQGPCWEVDGALQFAWNFPERLFRRSTVERLAEVCWSYGTVAVSPMITFTCSMGMPISWATIWANTVLAPWPMSDVPEYTRALPSASKRTVE